MIMNLHERLGIIFGLGLPKFAFSSPVNAIKDHANLVANEFNAALLQTSAEALDVPVTESPISTRAADLLDVDCTVPASPISSSSPFQSAPVAATPHADHDELF